MYMDVCVVRLHKKTKASLDRYKEYRNESYDEVVAKLVGIVENCKKEDKGRLLTAGKWFTKTCLRKNERKRSR